MRKVITALIVIAMFVTILWVSGKVSDAHMSMCADHETQTLYECNEQEL